MDKTRELNGLCHELASDSPKRSSCVFWLLLILIITAVAYAPALSGDFLNFDDHRFRNPRVINTFNLENFKTIFFMPIRLLSDQLSSKHTDLLFDFNWVSLLSFQLNRLFTSEYLGFVIFAIACHLLQTVFFWNICRRLSQTLGIAVLATAIFSLHPIHTNHVVWQSARWHLLAVTFCLFSAWQYLNAIDQAGSRAKRIISYVLSVLAYSVLIFGRPFYVIFPLIVVVIDFLKRRRISLVSVLHTIPFFLLALANALLAHRAGQVATRISAKWVGGSFWNTILTDLNLNLEYLRQLLIPSSLTLVVPINEASGLFKTLGPADLALLKLPPIISLAFFVALFACAIWLWRRHKSITPLILLLGIVATVAHVQNIPPKRGIAGVFAYRYIVLSTAFAAPLVAMIFIGLYNRYRQSRAHVGLVLCLISGYLLYCFSMTIHNVQNFKNSENLWTNHVRMLPSSRAGHYYLGKVYHYDKKDPYRAISAYKRALELPHYWGASALNQRLAQAYTEIEDWQNAKHTMSGIRSRTIARSKHLQNLKAKIDRHVQPERLPEMQYAAPKTSDKGQSAKLESNNKVVLFDMVHSIRHSAFSNHTKDSIEYNVIQGYGRLQELLRDLGFEVRELHFGRLTPELLKQIDILMIGIMSSRAMEMSESEITAVLYFVRSGGGLHVVSDHTDAYDSTKRLNKLLQHFDIEVADSLVVDKTAAKDSWYHPKRFVKHPVTNGLEILVHQAGCSLITNHGLAFTDPNAWADQGNPSNGIGRFGNKRKEPDEIVGELPVFAARTFGKGRMAVTTDCNLYGNSWIFSHDNYRLARNAFSWLAKTEPRPLPKNKTEILIHEGSKRYFRVNWRKQAYLSFYANFGHMKSVRPFLSTELSYDKNAIFLFDRVTLNEKTQQRLFQYLKDGGALVYLCTAKNFFEPRTAFLKRYGIEFRTVSYGDANKDLIPVTGDPDICRDVFHLPWVPTVKLSGAKPVVYDDANRGKTYVAVKNIGKGMIYVVPFKSIFKTKFMGQGTTSRNRDMAQQQVRRLQENIVNSIVLRH